MRQSDSPSIMTDTCRWSQPSWSAQCSLTHLEYWMVEISHLSSNILGLHEEGSPANMTIWDMIYKIWAMRYDLGDMSYELYEFLDMSSEIGAMSFKIWAISYEIGDMSYEIWATIMSLLLCSESVEGSREHHQHTDRDLILHTGRHLRQTALFK